jgi:hypothetical protein
MHKALQQAMDEKNAATALLRAAERAWAKAPPSEGVAWWLHVDDMTNLVKEASRRLRLERSKLVVYWEDLRAGDILVIHKDQTELHDSLTVGRRLMIWRAPAPDEMAVTVLIQDWPRREADSVVRLPLYYLVGAVHSEPKDA